MPGLPVARIWEIASFDRKIRAYVALELVASWPIPGHHDGALRYSFFYYASFGPPPAKSFKLYPPSWVVWILAADGSIHQLRHIQPKQIGLDGKPDEPFATHAWPPEWTVEEADQKRKDLLAAYDRVVAFWEAQRRPTSSDTELLADFRRRFLEITPPALLPCYQLLGREFFQWTGI
jgi:hypothetical protein